MHYILDEGIHDMKKSGSTNKNMTSETAPFNNYTLKQHFKNVSEMGVAANVESFFFVDSLRASFLAP